MEPELMGSARLGFQKDPADPAGQRVQQLPGSAALFPLQRIYDLKGTVIHIQPLFQADLTGVALGNAFNQGLIGLADKAVFKLTAQLPLRLFYQSPDHQARRRLVQSVNHQNIRINFPEPGIEAVRLIRPFAGNAEELCGLLRYQKSLVPVDQPRKTQKAAPQTRNSIRRI